MKTGKLARRSTNRQAERCTEKQNDQHTYKWVGRCTGRHTDKLAQVQACKQTQTSKIIEKVMAILITPLLMA